VQILAESLPVGGDIKDARIEQFVEQNRVPGQVVGGPRRAADQFGELHQRLRILLQQRQIGAAPADRIEEIEAALPGRVGVAGGRSGVDQAWPEGIEALAVARRQLQVAAALAEALQTFEHRLWLAETQRGQALERIVAGHWVVPDSGQRMPALLRLREDLLEMAGDGRPVASRTSRNPCQSAQPIEAAICWRSASAARQAMRLGVVHVLQTVLEAAQELIGGCQLALGLRR
jgi:hypothetical protein